MAGGEARVGVSSAPLDCCHSHRTIACDMLFLCSDKLCLFKQEEEWASLHGGGIDEGRLVKLAIVPELQPFEIVRAHLNIIIHPAMLEEELLVAPVRADGVRAAD